MDPFFRFADAKHRHPDVESWLSEHNDELGSLARCWFHYLRKCGPDVREILHDNRPTACVGDIAFAYVDRFKAHINIGFFCGHQLPDPTGILQGTGKRMRHIKLTPDSQIEESEIESLILAAYSAHG